MARKKRQPTPEEREAALLVKKAERDAARKARDAKKPKKPVCGKPTKRGTPCQATALMDNGICMAHQTDEVQKKYGFGGTTETQRKGGKMNRVVRAVDLQRQLVEAAVDKVLFPYFEALGLKYEVEHGLDGAQVKVEWAGDAPGVGGLVLHGESKDGDIIMTDHPDIAGRVAIAEKLLDRVYGKPKQSHELAGSGGGPVRVSVPRSEQRAVEVVRILAEAGSLPGIAAAQHDGEGRKRRLPPRRGDAVSASAEASTNGHSNGNK